MSLEHGLSRAPRRGPLRRAVVDPVLRGAIAVQTLLVDARFVRRQGITPTIGQRVLAYPAIGWERLSRATRDERQDLLFRRYVRLHPLHYGPGGRGYQSVPVSTPDQRRERYLAQNSRLAWFAETFADLLDYADGDTFVDLGCGTGQNIRWLVSAFPNSPITGADLSADAVGLIRECEPSERVSVEAGDITDLSVLDALLDRPVDHIVISHVFSLLFASSRAETVALRQAIIDRLVDACRKSVTIIDTFGPSGSTTITIEQRQRAVVSDDVMRYFPTHASGRTVMARSDITQAVMFLKQH
jgi:SAM-dependent methyltransferase